MSSTTEATASGEDTAMTEEPSRPTSGRRMAPSAEPAPADAAPPGAATAAGLAGRDTGAADWEDLVTSALLGTDRRRPRLAASGTDVPAALLDAAAVRTVRHRAGLRPAPAAPRPEPAADDPRQPLPPAAARRLAQLLEDRLRTGGGRRSGTAPDLIELLPQWLSDAGRHGYAPPAHLLPALLDTARGRTDLRARILAFAGPRALWLARFNPDWRFALRVAPGEGPALAATADAAQVKRHWEEGVSTERLALLTAVRAEDPQAARKLLAASWSTERVEDRLMFLECLRQGLAGDDEPFLEKSLTDRSRNVRALAAELLSVLPGSALAARMTTRASSCVTLDRTGQTATITVEAPYGCDAGMERDGVVQKPPAGRGQRAWWFGQLVEATPLAVWTARLGDRSPVEIVALPVADDWRGELHAAWCRAAVRQRDIAWSRALLGTPTASEAAGPGAVSLTARARLLSALPPAERARWVADFIAVHNLPEAFQLLGSCAAPWPTALGRAVVDALRIARDTGSYPWSYSGVMGLAERYLDPAEAPRLEGLTAVPDESTDASPAARRYWAESFQRLVATLRLRETMRAELMAA